MLFSYQVNGSTLSMTQVQGRALGGDFSGQFKLPLTKNFSHYETELELSGIDPFPFLAYFYPDLSGFSKPVHAHLSLKGSGWTISSLDGRGSLTLRSSQTPSPIPVPSARLLETPSGHKKSQIMKGLLSLAQQIDLQFTLSHKRLSLLSAHLSTPRSILALAGTIDEDQKMILAYHLAPGDLGELLPLFGLERLEGRAELSGLLTGSLSQPLSQAHLTVAEANYKGRAVGSLSSQLLFQNDALDISPALLQKGSSLYKLLGRITFPREKTHLKEGRAAPVYNLTLHIEKGIPQEVVALFYKEIPIHGSAGGDLYLTGTPKEFQLKGTLNVGSGSAYGQPFDSGSVTGIVERNGITLEHVGLRWNDTVLAGQGTISFDGSFSAQLSTEGFQLEEIKLIHNLFPALTGTITGIIRGKGPFRDPHVTLTADIARIAYEGQDLGEGRVEAALEERKLRVHSDLFEKALSFTGHLGLISPYPYEVGLLLNQVRIDPFLALAQPKLFSALLLSSTGEISGMGTLSRLQEASFQISLSDLRLQLGEHLVRNDGDIRLQYQGGVLKVDALKFQGEETTLAISGSLEPFREYNLFVRGETDLNLLRLFTREITHGKGKAYLALRIFDRWSDPKIRGGLTSQGGTIRSETLSQTVNLQSLGLLFNEKQILLESLEGEVGGGHLSGSGKVDIKNFATEAFGLILELKDVRFHVPEGLSSLVEGALIFQGTSESRDLKGEVVIKRATYTKRVEWKSWITEIIAAQTREQKGEIPLVGNTHLNIHITGKENIWIDNNLAKFPLIVDLYLRGTLNRPLLLGRVEAREGTFFFRRNTFKITNGSIDFINPERTQPIFDVKAKTTVRNYQIDLNLSGSLDSFRLALTSDPPLSETDILALLVVGKTAEEVAAAQKGVGTTEVVSIATGDVQDIFEQRIEELTGIDRFQVDPYYSGTKTAGGPRLTVSKKLLNDDLVVTYSVTLDPSEEQTILMEYLLSQNIFLEGRRDELGRLLGNIKFRFEFR
jgi:translocation and assembly module TamB